MTSAEAELEALEGGMSAATAGRWLPLLKKALDASSHHGSGPSPFQGEVLPRVLSKAIALAPGDWELLCLRGVLRAGSSEFELASADFAEAIALSPKSAKPYADRAYLHSRLGDWESALEDMDRAASLSGGGGASLDRGLVLLSLGRAAEAAAELARFPSDPEARFHLGRALLAQGRAGEAEAEARAALAGSGAGSSRRRQYELIGAAAAALGHVDKAGAAAAAPGERFMSEAKKKAAKRGTGCLWLLGVGIDRPYEVTLNTLMALRRCDAVYTQADTREVRELLEAVFPGVRTIATGGGRGANPQDAVWKAVKAELDRGAQTGYVTYGHPMLFGEGNMMAKRCKEAGYAYRVLTAPSSIDGILTMLQEDLDLCERGFSVGNARSLLEPGAKLDAAKGAIILGVNRVMEEGRFAAFCAALEDAYPSSHVLYALKCGDGYRDETRLRLTLAELRAKERELDPALTLFIPELKGRPRKK